MNIFSALLLWVEVLLSLLLLMSAFFAWTARWSSGVGRTAVRTLFILAVAVPVLALAASSCVLISMKLTHSGWKLTFPLALAFLVALIVLMSLKRSRIAQWPVARLWIALLVAISIAGMTLWNMDVSARLRMQIARADAAALAVSLAPPIVPDEQNAAVVYDSVFQLFNDPRTAETRKKLEDMRCGTTQWNGALASEYLQQLDGTVRELKRASSRPYCRFDYPYSRPDISMMVPSLAWLRDSSNLLSCASRAAADRGRPEEALHLASSMYRVQQHTGGSLALVSELVAFGIGSTADQTLAQVLPYVKDTAQLQALDLPPAEGLRRMAIRSLRSEEAMVMSIMAEMVQRPEDIPQFLAVMGTGSRSDTGNWAAMAGAWISRLYSWQDEVEGYQQAISVVRELSATPVYQWKLTDKQLEAEFVERSHRGVLVRHILPSFAAIGRHASIAVASRDMALMALAATRYRLDNRRYPTTADELVPHYMSAIPIDPFDGKALRMKQDGGGLLFYSVGSDRKDDGGKGEKNVDHVLRLGPATSPQP